MRTLFLLAALGLLAWTMGRRVHTRASRSPAMKKRMLVGGCLCLVLGLVIALWLPGRVPETQGSPATLVAILVLWVLGGGLAYVGIISVVGALMARPPVDDPTQPMPQ